MPLLELTGILFYLTQTASSGNLLSSTICLTIRKPMLLINESKLDSEISASEFIPDNLGYTVYRKVRNRHSGDIMILIKNCYSSQIVDADAEFLWIEVQLKNQGKLLLSTFYRPPSSDDDYLKLFDASRLDIRTRTASSPNHTIIVCGDFKLPDINWEHKCVSASSS